MSETARPIALDSTKLLSADSYLATLLGTSLPGAPRDPGGRQDLVESLAVYLDGRPVFHPLPKQEVQDPTPLLEMWNRRRDQPLFLRAIDVDPAPVAKTLASDFRRLVVTRGKEVAAWVRFQFHDDQMARIYWQGGNTPDDLLVALDCIVDLRVDSDGRAFREELNSEKLAIPRTHLAHLSASELRPLKRDPMLFALSYAFHAFRKGYLYARRLSDAGVAYWSHWLREGAITGSLHSLVARQPDQLLLNMGAVIVGLLERRQLRLERSALEETLSAVRGKLAALGGPEAVVLDRHPDALRFVAEALSDGAIRVPAESIAPTLRSHVSILLRVPCQLLRILAPEQRIAGGSNTGEPTMALLQTRPLGA